MRQSQFLAGLIGPMFLAIGVSLLLQRAAIARMLEEIRHNSAVVYLSGIILFMAGLAMVRAHDVWIGWPTLVTLLGWFAVVGGLVRIFFAHRAADIARFFLRHPTAMTMMAVMLLMLGLFLTLKGYELA